MSNIFNISTSIPEITEEIKKLAGKPYGFTQILKLRGIGSQRLEIIDGSHELIKLFRSKSDTPLCNIELRVAGVIIRFRSHLEVYAWVIPYSQILIEYLPDSLKISDNSFFMNLRGAHKAKIDFSFFDKLVTLKNARF